MNTTGCIFIVISKKNEKTGIVTRTHQQAYISDKVEDLVISREAMESLSFVSDLDDRKRASVRVVSSTVMNPYSSINTSPIQPLAMMNTDKPVHLFVDPAVKPVAMNKAAIIPIHLKARVKADLDRDVRLGILEKVDINSPVKWLSCMLVTMKKDRSPRRIIDYKKLDNAIPRQTNITKSPFMCASDCPPGKKKSILDAKDGYHSVVLEKGESRAVTEFLCEFC